MELSIRNFQGHRRSDLTLRDGITALVGVSDQGKSSVVRSIRWVAEGKPTGSNFIRKGTKECKVILDGVTHSKTASTSSYSINGGDQLKALRTNVPDEVAKVLNFGPDTIQTQHKSIFLLDESPGKVADKLSELINLEPARDALKAIGSKKRALTAELATTEKALETNKIKLLSLAPVTAADEELCIIESEMAVAAKLEVQATQLCQAVKHAAEARLELTLLPNTDALEPAKELLANRAKMVSLVHTHDAIITALNQIDTCNEILCVDTTAVYATAKEILDETDKHQELANALANIEKATAVVREKDKAEKALLLEKTEIMGDRCPLCGGEVNA